LIVSRRVDGAEVEAGDLISWSFERQSAQATALVCTIQVSGSSATPSTGAAVKSVSSFTLGLQRADYHAWASVVMAALTNIDSCDLYPAKPLVGANLRTEVNGQPIDSQWNATINDPACVTIETAATSFIVSF
jgi:hypothetical protein